MRFLLILVGLHHLCGPSISQECNPQFMENEEFPGTDSNYLQSPDAEHCQWLCTQDPSCHFFTFIRANSSTKSSHFRCYLKSIPSGQPKGQAVQGVTSGFSLKPCKTRPKPCLSQVYHDVDFSGADYQTLFTADYEECQRACTNDPSCQFFTYVNENFTSPKYRYKCHLQFSWTVPRTTRVEANPGLVSGFSQNIQITQQSDTACQATLFPNTDIPGNNIENLSAASPEHCHVLCTAHPKCTYFSYASDGFMCHLKNNPNEMVVKAKLGVTSGIPARFCQQDNTWAKTAHAGVDFWGSDLEEMLRNDADACQRTCTEDHNCQFYTYVTESFFKPSIRGLCYLKRVITVPAPPKVSKLANVVSGFSLKNCASSALPTDTPALEDIFEYFT